MAATHIQFEQFVPLAKIIAQKLVIDHLLYGLLTTPDHAAAGPSQQLPMRREWL